VRWWERLRALLTICRPYRCHSCLWRRWLPELLEPFESLPPDELTESLPQPAEPEHG
jgi:hypothetical protein